MTLQNFVIFIETTKEGWKLLVSHIHVNTKYRLWYVHCTHNNIKKLKKKTHVCTPIIIGVKIILVNTDFYASISNDNFIIYSTLLLQNHALHNFLSLYSVKDGKKCFFITSFFDNIQSVLRRFDIFPFNFNVKSSEVSWYILYLQYVYLHTDVGILSFQ